MEPLPGSGLTALAVFARRAGDGARLGFGLRGAGGAAATRGRDEWRDHFGAWFVLGVLVSIAYAAAAPAIAPAAAIARAQALRGGCNRAPRRCGSCSAGRRSAFRSAIRWRNLRALSIAAGAGFGVALVVAVGDRHAPRRRGRAHAGRDRRRRGGRARPGAVAVRSLQR